MNTSEKHQHSSGATSSHLAPRYDLIPREFLKALALRYSHGATQHGDYNYRKGLSDRAFIVDRINHIHEHLGQLFQPSTESSDDLLDNLGAIAWGIAFLCEVADDATGQQILAELRRP